MAEIPKRFALAVITAQVLGTAITLPVLGSFRLERLWTPRFAPRFAPEAIPDYQLGFEWRPDAVTPGQYQVDGLATLTGLWLGLGLLALFVTCVTLTVLVVRRGATRHDELALHAAMGARRKDLFRALFRESSAMALVGAAIGGALGLAGFGVLRASWPEGLGPPSPLSSLAPVAVLAPALTVLTAGLYPARHIRAWLRTPERVRAVGALWERAIIAGYVTGLVVLLSVAGLLLRGHAARSAAAPPFLHTTDTLVIDVTRLGPEVAFAESPSPASRGAAAVADIVAAMADVSGIGGASLVSAGVIRGLGMTEAVVSECFCSAGLIAAPYIRLPIQHHAASPGFFEQFGIRVLSGREFETTDGSDAPLVAVIDRALAQRFRGVEPIGKRMRIGPRAGIGPFTGPWYEIVGVVESFVPQGVGTRGVARPSVYLSALQHTPTAATLLLTAQASDGPRPVDSPRRSYAPPGSTPEPGSTGPFTPSDATVAGIEDVLARVAPRAEPAGIRTLEEVLDRLADPLRWLGGLVLILGLGVVVLAVVGLRSAVSLEVWRRASEIGVRRATGASRRDIGRQMLTETARTAAVGLAPGIVLAVGFARGLEELIAGFDGWDPLIYALVAVIVASTALAGAWRPARRAARLEPVEAICREE